MSRTNRTRYTVLGCLSFEPMSGYDIKGFIDGTISHFWSESYGQLYPTLKALEEEGKIVGHEEPGEGGPSRIVYRITDAGREELAQWLREPAQPVTARDEHSLKIFFGHLVGTEATLAHVRRLRDRARAALDHYTRVEARLENADLEWVPYRLAVLHGGIRHSEMVLEWCDETEAALREVEGP